MDQCGRSVGRCVSPPSLFLSPPQPCFLINSSFPRRPQVLWITTKGDHPKKQNNTSRSRSTPHSPLSSLLRQTLETTDRAGCGCSLHVQERVLWNAMLFPHRRRYCFKEAGATTTIQPLPPVKMSHFASRDILYPWRPVQSLTPSSIQLIQCWPVCVCASYWLWTACERKKRKKRKKYYTRQAHHIDMSEVIPL